MQGIYTYIPETNYAPKEYSVAAILLLLFMVLLLLVPVLNLLYFYICTFRSTCAVPSMAVFCSSLTSCFPGMLLTYFLNDFEMVPVAPIITGITFVFTFHMSVIIIIIIIIKVLNDLYSSPNIVRVIRSRRMRWAGHVACMGEIRTYRRFGCGNWDIETTGRPRRRWECNIKMNLQEVGFGFMDWMELVQDRDMWRALVNAIMNIQVP